MIFTIHILKAQMCVCAALSASDTTSKKEKKKKDQQIKKQYWFSFCANLQQAMW